MLAPQTVNTISAAVDKIQNALPGEIVKINCSISDSDYTTIKNAIASRTQPIGIDLSAVSMTTLSSGLLNQCSKICYLKLPNTLTTIGSGALLGCGCGSTFKLTIPKNVTTIASRGTEASCYAVEVESGNTSFKAVDGVLYSYDGTTLYTYPKYKTDVIEYTVPNGVTTIKESSLYSTQLQGIVFPASLTLIERAAMNNQSHLIVVYFMGVNSTLTIKDSVFQNDSKLESIIFVGSKSDWETKVTCTTISGNTSWLHGTKVTEIMCNGGGNIDVSSQAE